MVSEPPRYVHGTAPEEQRRLSRLNDLINEPSLREIGLTGGERILDVGSGLGQFTRQLARKAGPSGRVIGIEASAAQIEEALRQAREAGEGDLVELRQGDARSLPLSEEEWDSFDVVHARFLLEHVRDPVAVVRQMARACRAGGRVVLADDDHDVLRLWPEPPGLEAVWQAYIRSYLRAGHDPYVGRRLVWLLHEAGLVPRRTSWIFFGDCAGGPDFDALVENLVMILRGARDAIVDAGLLPRLFEDALGALREWQRRPDAAFWYAICWAEGEKP
jgi:ubiquinone/menaquinone biosynthesis C-methylase UbiE